MYAQRGARCDGNVHAHTLGVCVCVCVANLDVRYIFHYVSIVGHTSSEMRAKKYLLLIQMG
ncbi:hypothetical protein DSCOOX_22020 [Desulfosarcina ovata subsp. ovata]|uniref:Uncharacterized protein n=1 Tax=Desulfosarcina ovata subsp. ovata TaxID=2752305 RepID=A0A5K8A8Q8_9BACT|nr:hypothetical protein DSCOOX_22020 [Desulfosarcina ovata subsp. ovata]